MKSEFTLAFNEITERFGLTSDTVMEALEAAMVSAYRRAVNASSAQQIAAKLHPESGEVEIFAEKEVVEDVENPLTEVELSIARRFDPDSDLGDMVLVESTPNDFGRVAAQTAKQVILQRLREAERDAQYQEFVEREGDMVHGTVHSVTPHAVTVGLGRAEAILPRNQQIPGEHFRVRDRIRVYVLEVRKSSRGPVIVVSRTHPNMLRRLLEMEVPEINQGLVEIRAIAREAGKRAKVAVSASREGVDPVGACVGLRGVRIQSIVRDLNDEKIDVIEWNPLAEIFIAKALSPARVSGVYLDDDPERGKTAIVVVPEDQLSLAIGRAGVNARLGAKLTGWRIDIKSLVEAASESHDRMLNDEAYTDMAEDEAKILPEIESVLVRKAEGRPIPPEDYQLLGSFVDRIQGEVVARRAKRRKVELKKLAEVRDKIPASAYDVDLEALDLSTRTFNLLDEAGYKNVGKVMEHLWADEDQLLKLQGFGPKAMEELEEKIEAYDFPVEVEEELAVEAEPQLEGAELEPQALPVEQLDPVEEPALTEALEPAEASAVAAEAEAEPELLAEAEAEVQAEADAEAEPVEAEVATTDIEEVFEAAAEEVEEVLFHEARPIPGDDEEDEEDDEEEKKRKKRKSRVVEFDPELGETIVRRRRKRSRKTDWDEFEKFTDMDDEF